MQLWMGKEMSHDSVKLRVVSDPKLWIVWGTWIST
jgi:hypothetical protein